MNKEATETIESRVKDIIVDVLRVKHDQLGPTTHLMKDLGADSLDALDVALRIEKTFNMRIPDEAVPNYMTINDIINGITMYTRAQEEEATPETLTQG